MVTQIALNVNEIYQLDILKEVALYRSLKRVVTGYFRRTPC